MSPLRRPVILDNDVISRLFAAGALRQILELWPKGTFLVTGRVLDEARKWRGRGQELSRLLKEMEADGILEVVAVDESSEEEAEAYMRLALQNKLGRGETASIAIASNRGFDLATDDQAARDACRTLYPSISILGTGSLLNVAVRDSLMPQHEADAIRDRIRRRDRD